LLQWATSANPNLPQQLALKASFSNLAFVMVTGISLAACRNTSIEDADFLYKPAPVCDTSFLEIVERQTARDSTKHHFVSQLDCSLNLEGREIAVLRAESKPHTDLGDDLLMFAGGKRETALVSLAIKYAGDAGWVSVPDRVLAHCPNPNLQTITASLCKNRSGSSVPIFVTLIAGDGGEAGVITFVFYKHGFGFVIPPKRFLDIQRPGSGGRKCDTCFEKCITDITVPKVSRETRVSWKNQQTKQVEHMPLPADEHFN